MWNLPHPNRRPLLMGPASPLSSLIAEVVIRVVIALFLLVMVAALAGCPATRPDVTPPQVVRVTVTKYVPVPDKFTKDCPIAEPTKRSVHEAIDVANARKTSLQDCNIDKAAIRNLAVPSSAGTP